MAPLLLIAKGGNYNAPNYIGHATDERHDAPVHERSPDIGPKVFGGLPLMSQEGKVLLHVDRVFHIEPISDQAARNLFGNMVNLSFG